MLIPRWELSLICYSLNSVDCKPEILDLCFLFQAGPQSALPQPDCSAFQRLSRLSAPSTSCQCGWTGVRQHHWGEWVWWRGGGRRRPTCCCGANQPCAAGESSPQCLQPTHRTTGSWSNQWVCTTFTSCRSLVSQTRAESVLCSETPVWFLFSPSLFRLQFGCRRWEDRSTKSSHPGNIQSVSGFDTRFTAVLKFSFQLIYF